MYDYLLKPRPICAGAACVLRHGLLAQVEWMQGRIEVQYGDQDNAISDCSVVKQ